MFRIFRRETKNIIEPTNHLSAEVGSWRTAGEEAPPSVTRKMLTRGEFFLFILVSFLALSYVSISSIYSRSDSKESKDNTSEVVILHKKNISPVVVDPYQGLDLHAKAVYVFDLKNKKPLFSKNENEVLPLASLTKIMTMLKANEIVPKDSVIEIDKDALGREGDTGLFLGEEWNLRALMDLSLVASSNDGAYAIASKADSILNQTKNNSTPLASFVESMNDKAKELGLSGMHFNNETGLDENDEIAGGYGTARDVANLFSYVIEKDSTLLEATKYEVLNISSLAKRDHLVKNTSSVMNSIPALIASKTGYTDLAQGNLVVAFDTGVNYPVVIVVLGSTYDGRFEDVEKLSVATLQYLGVQK